MRYDNWDDFMAAQRRSGLLQRISDFVTAERRGWFTPTTPAATATKDGPPTPVYPSSGDVFRFTTTPLRDVKVVILGQDPYHEPGQAHGLAFSVPEGVTPPPSLKNIFRELDSDLRAASGRMSHYTRPTSGDLTLWTRQGVLLLNTALTVRQADPGSHLDIWQPFTNEVVRAVVDSADVAPHFILWGRHAKDSFTRCVGKLAGYSAMLPSEKGCFSVFSVSRSQQHHATFSLVTATYSPHPSPLSADRGFFGSRPFSRANLALKLNNPGHDCQIDWRLP